MFHLADMDLISLIHEARKMGMHEPVNSKKLGETYE